VRLFALLLLAAILGFAVGRLTAPEERGLRGPKSTLIPPAERGTHSGDQVVTAEEPARAVEIEEPGPPADVVLPSEPSEEPGDGGILLVDLGGRPCAWVGNVEILGGYDQVGIDAEEDQARCFWAPGIYDVWWLDQEGRRLGTRARIDAGKVTRLRVADHRAAAPVPRGFGVLSLFVEAADGAGLGAHVAIHDGHDSIDVWTNDDGYASSVIRPGLYRLSVGNHVSEAAVEEGRTTAHRIAHGPEGDLVLVADRMLNISVHRGGDPGLCWNGSIGAPPGSAETVPYLAEGEYDLFIPYSFGAPLARVKVHAGRATRFRCEPPAGGVVVRVVPESGQVYIGRGLGGDTNTPQELTRLPRGGRPDPIVLMPGRYVLTAYASGCNPASTEFGVSDRVVEVTLELSPLR
jgi:hypothetical protein